ncbi:MAG TPA: CvpA family protein [Burkholderiales bacterium]|jgi:membrane protein required for colicin V production|nr:CvpA family protein [Burkholderiales bacterium]
MTAFDYAVVAIIGLSVLFSIMRGLVREVLALVAWVVAFVVARMWAVDGAHYVPSAVTDPALRVVIAFVVLFLVALIAMGFLTRAVSALVRVSGLGFVDRGLGAMFGFARGVLIVTIVVLIAGMTPLPHDAAWRNAVLRGPFESLAVSVKPWLPRDLSTRISYN